MNDGPIRLCGLGGLAGGAAIAVPDDLAQLVVDLRENARRTEAASRLMAEAKTARQTDRDDYPDHAGPRGYDWLKAEQTVSWKAADAIEALASSPPSDMVMVPREVLADVLESCARYADFIRQHVGANDIEMHPYLPALEEEIAAGRAALATAPASALSIEEGK